MLRCSVACFSDCLSKCLFSLIFQVSLVFVFGTLDSSCRHVSGDRIVGECFQDTLELGRGGGGGHFSGLVGSCAFSPFYQFGIMEWN